MPRALLLALALTACAPPPMASEQAIVGGTLEPDENAVVAVTVLGAVGLCTGTVIAPNVVLTAKHCVQAAGADAPYPPNVLTVGVGGRIGATRDYRVERVFATPGVFNQSATTGLSGEIFGVDIGLVITRRDIEGVTPIAVRRDAPVDVVGQEFTAIGFGQRPDGPAGIKYRTTGTLDSIQSNGVLLTSMTICSGDSGGPAIQEGEPRQVIGVASFGQAGQCPSAQDGYNAVYNNLDLIDRALVIAGHCPTASAEVCNGVDDDCNGQVDEGCARIGETCAEDTDCAYAQRPAFLEPHPRAVVCRDAVCALPCDPLRPLTSCAAVEGAASAEPLDGLLCARVDGCEAYCAPGAVGAGADGEPCAAATDCASGSCADPGDGAQRCLTPCEVGAGSCPVGDACVGLGDGCGACVDAAIVAGARQLGEPCEADAECAGGASCLDGACATSCDAATPCAPGYRCEGLACVRGQLGQVTDPCGEDADCAGGLTCASGGFCTRACASDDECPDGARCGDVDGATRCAPTLPQIGEACSGACQRGVCEDGTCAQPCGPEAVCSAGYACQRDDRGAPRCRATGGCAVSPGAGPIPTAGLMVLALCLGVGARRGGRRRRA